MQGDSVIDFVYGVAAIAAAGLAVWGIILVLEMMSPTAIKMVGGSLILFPMSVLVGHAVRAKK